MAPGDRAAAGGMGVVPVFHVVLLGHAGRARVANVVVAQEILDLLRRVAVDKQEPPDLGLVRALRMPHGERSRRARQRRSVGENLARGSDQPAVGAGATAPLLLAMAEILG